MHSINRKINTCDFNIYMYAKSETEAITFLPNPNGVMTREQALAKMKEAKDLLDLGIMSQSDYDALKEKLTPIILNNPWVCRKTDNKTDNV